jgi:hypothetical protein
MINERMSIWQKYDESQQQLKVMQEHASDLDASNTSPITSELSVDHTPPAEIAAAFQGFQLEIRNIQKYQENINVLQEEIKNAESHRLTILIITGIVIFGFLCVLALGGFTLISALLSSISQ